MCEEKFIKGQGYDWTKSLSDTDTIRVFVFDSKQYEETDWFAIRDQIKMWPSYEESIKNAEALKP